MAGNLGKPTKPRWADGAAPYAVEPSLGKKILGWLSQEKPPFQWMNWLFLKNKEWIDHGEYHQDILYSVFFRSDSTIGWSGTQITFSQDLEIIFKVGGDVWQNEIALADSPISLADGEVLVAIFDDDNTTLTSAAYGAIAAGNYSIVAEASLTENEDEQEVIMFRRRGSQLEIPLINEILDSGDTYSFGGMQVHTHQSNAEGGQLDHGLALTGLSDDDHTIYSLADGTRDFTGIVGYDSHKAFAADTDIIDKKYVDDNIPTLPLSIANGGTNNNSFTSGRLTYYNGTSIVSASGLYTNGTQLGIGGSPSYSLHIQDTAQDVGYFQTSNATGKVYFNANGVIQTLTFQSNGYIFDNNSGCGIYSLGNVFSVHGSHDGYGASYTHDLIEPYESSLAGGGSTADLATIVIGNDQCFTMKVWVRAYETAAAANARSDLVIGHAGRTGAGAPVLAQVSCGSCGALAGAYSAQFVLSGNTLIFRVTSGTNAIAIRAWIIKE